MAQGLAQTAVHSDRVGRNFFLPAEQTAGGIGKPGQKSLRQLLKEIHKDETIKEDVKKSDRALESIMYRAPQEMLRYAAQYTVSESQVEEREADMINSVGELLGSIFQATEDLLTGNHQSITQVLHKGKTRRSSWTFSYSTVLLRPFSFPRFFSYHTSPSEQNSGYWSGRAVSTFSFTSHVDCQTC